MARRTAFSSPVAAFLITSLLLPPAGAIAQTPQEEPTFFESVDVSVVNVEVFVTDRNDKRVKGLTQNDFEILEDGKRVEISYFYVQDEPAAPGGPDINVVEAPTAEVPEEQRSYLAIFVDNQNLPPAGRNRILPELKKFLTTELRPQDRVMLATYNGPGTVQVRQAPTRDPQALVQVIDEIAKSAAGLGAKAEQQFIVRDMDNSSFQPSTGDDQRDQMLDEADAEFSRSSIEIYAQQAANQAKSTLTALEQFVNGLSGLPGRKAVLFVSGGLSLRPAQALYDAWEQRYGRLGETQMDRLKTSDDEIVSDFERLTQRANANRVTFYSLGVSNVLAAGGAASRSNQVWTSVQENTEKNLASQSMAMLSGPTGGIALFDATDPAMLLTRMREDMDSFYSLGYVPSHRRTGKNHKIEVKVKQPGLRVRYRESFRDRTTQELMVDQTMSALLFGSDENPLEVAVEFQDVVGEKVKKDEKLVQLTVKLPMSKLVLLPQEQVHEGKVSVFLAVRDSNGRNSDITQVKIPVRIPNDRLMASLGQAAGYRTRLVMRSGEHTVAVGVRDELANVSSLVTQTYTPGQGTPIAGAAADAPADPPKKGTGL